MPLVRKKQQNDSGEGEKGKMPERFGESTWTNTKPPPTHTHRVEAMRTHSVQQKQGEKG